MSDADARSDIEREFEDAVKTADAYLRAVGVLDPIAISETEYREREIRAMRDNILKGWGLDLFLPSDPIARHATRLARQYLHCGRDADTLETLLERDCSHPAYREALNFVVHGLLATRADVPERLQNWDTEREKVTGKWTRENARNYLIGSVVEAMETGSGYFVRRDPDVVRLKCDLKRVCAKAGNPPNGLPTKHIVTALNAMRDRRWSKWNEGKGLTESDLSELFERFSRSEAHGITPKDEVRTTFPSLCRTRNSVTVPERSICDAVAEALGRGSQRRSYDAVVSAWRKYWREQPLA